MINSIIKALLPKEKREWFEVSNDLKIQFAKAKACVDVMDNWKHLSFDEMLMLYTKNAVFVIEHDMPSLEYMDKHFKGKCDKWGVFINEPDACSINQPVVIFNGKCTGNVIINKPSEAVHFVHVRHDSYAKIQSDNGAFVFVKLYGDKCHVKTKVCNNSKIVVFKYNEDGTKLIEKLTIRGNYGAEITNVFKGEK